MLIQKSRLTVAAALMFGLFIGAASVAQAAGISAAPAHLNGALANTVTNQTITLSGGTGIYPTMSVTGFNGNGTGLTNAAVTFNTGNGTFTVNGTPTAAGTATFTINVTDSSATMFSTNYTLSVFQLATPTFPSPVQALNQIDPTVSKQIITGGTGPVSVQINNVTANGTGLGAGNFGTNTANNAATISISAPAFALPLAAQPTIITTPGTLTFDIVVTDFNGNSFSTSNSLVVTPAPVQFYVPTNIPTGQTLAAGTAGANFSQTITAVGGTGNKTLTYSVGGTLPSGLTITPASGTVGANSITISGANPTAGTATINVTATDTLNASGVSNPAFVVTINPALNIAPNALAAATAGTASNQMITIGGGTTPYTMLTITNFMPGTTGLMMAALTPNAGTGTVTLASTNAITQGNGSNATVPATFTVNVTDTAGATLTKNYTFIVNPMLSILPASLPAGDVGFTYNPTIQISGGTTPFANFTVSNYNAGATGLPAPTTSTNGGNFVVFNTMPSGSGMVSFTVNVTDGAGATLTKNYTITINPALTATPSTLPNGDKLVMYNQTITIANGTPAYTTTISGFSAGTTGLGAPMVNGANTVVTFSGTPTGTGTATFTVNVTDSIMGMLSQFYSVTINPKPSFSPSAGALPATDVGAVYTQAITASLGTTPYTNLTVSNFVSGNTGLVAPTADQVTGKVTFNSTAVASGTATFNLSVTDSAGGTTTGSYSVVVNPALTLNPPGPSMPSTDVGVTYTQTINVANGTTNYTALSVSNFNPGTTGLTAPTATAVPSNTGTISFNSASTATGTATFDVSVTDMAGITKTQSYTVLVNPALTMTPATLVGGDVGVPYTQVINVNPGTLPYQSLVFSTPFSANGTGLSAPTLNQANGTITFNSTPTAVGTGPATFAITVTDAGGGSLTRSYSVIISPALTMLPTKLNGLAVGIATNQTITVNPGTTPYSSLGISNFISSTGLQQSDLTVDKIAGTVKLSGTPVNPGTVTFTVDVVDAANGVLHQNYSLSVFKFSPTFSGLTVGAAPNQTQFITGGVPPYSSVNVSLFNSGGTGLSTLNVAIDATAGTVKLNNTALNAPPVPTAAGTMTFNITVTDSAGAQFTIAESVTVNPPLIITPSAATGLSTATKNVNTNQILTVSGGTPSSVNAGIPVYPSITATNLVQPGTGLSISVMNNTVVLSGTPSTFGTATFDVTATDAAGGTLTPTTQHYTLTINDTLKISPTVLPASTAGKSYAASATVTGGTTPYKNVVISSPTGTQAANFTPSFNAGVLSVTGNPSAAGSVSFTLSLTDNVGVPLTQNYTIAVNAAISISPNAPVVSNAVVLPAATAGTSFTRTLTVTSGTTPYTTFAVNGFTPGTTGLTNANVTPNAGAGTIVLSGTATATGDATFTVNVTDTAGATLAQNYSIHINPAISFSAAFAQTTVGVFYSPTVTASNGTGAITLAYSITSGSLATGLSIAPPTGTANPITVSGTPTVAVNSMLQVVATDTVGATSTQNFLIIVNPALVINPAVLPGADALVAYSASPVTISNGTPPYTIVVNPFTPNGTNLINTINSNNTVNANVVISGTPPSNSVGNFTTFTVGVTDAAGASVTRDYAIGVSAKPSIAPLTLPNTTAGLVYNKTITVSNGTKPFTTFAVNNFNAGTTGLVQAGFITTNGALGTVTLNGTPATAGTFSFDLNVTDTAGGTASQTFSVVVHPAVQITTVSLPPWTVSQVSNTTNYSQTIAATGGTAANGSLGGVTFAVTSSVLPTGLSLNSTTGAITGSPTGFGTFNFTITASDALVPASTNAKSFSILINPAVTFTPTTLPPGDVGTVYGPTNLVTVTSGTPPYTTFTVSALTGTTGLSMTPDLVNHKVQLSGTPTASGTATFSITTVDSGGESVTQPYSITVNPALTIVPTFLNGAKVLTATTQVITIGNGSPAYILGVSNVGNTSGNTGFTNSNTNLKIGVPTANALTVTGTPTGPGVFSFTVNASDAAGGTLNQVYNLSVFNFSPNAFSALTVGKSTPQGMTITGGVKPYSVVSVSAVNSVGTDLTATNFTVDANLGTVSFNGTPTLPGTVTFNVTVIDNIGNSFTTANVLTVNPPPAWTPAGPTAPAADVGVPYTKVFTVTGGTKPFTILTPTSPTTFSAGATGLTAPIVDQAAGTITFNSTPTASGTVTFTANVSDANSASAVVNYSIPVNLAPTIAPTVLVAATAGTAKSQTLTISNGTKPYTALNVINFAPSTTGLTNGSFVLDQVNGTVQVNTTNATTAGTATFTVTLSDTAGGSLSQNYSLVVNPPVAITTGTLSNWTVNKSGYNSAVVATGGTGALTYSVGAGLPTGLSLSASTGIITGMPTVAGGPSSFVITATDTNGSFDSHTYFVTINPAVQITTASLPPWTNNFTAYNQTLTTTGGTGSLTFTTNNAALPPGISLSTAGVFSGTPTSAGTYSFTVTATDSVGATGTKTLTIIVNAAVSISTASVPAWTKGFATYNQTLAATGGTGALTFTTNNATLPPGITLSTSGVLSGTPSSAGSFTFVVTATDTISATGTKSFTLVVNSSISISTVSLPAWTRNLAGYNQSVAATGGTGSLTFSVPTNSLPPGISLSGAGALTGNPTTAGTFPFTITATDSIGATGTQNLTIIINPVVSITTASLPPWTNTFPTYNQTITSTGGTGSITFSTTSNLLPPGISLSGAGVLSGTPTTAGTYTFTVIATDSVGATGTKNLQIIINPFVVITSSATLQAWTKNLVGYNQTIVATGGTGTVTFSTVPANLPPGLTLSTAGVLSGTPTTSGNYSFDVTATDSIGDSDVVTFSVVVNPVVSITTASLPPWTKNLANYSQSITATGGTGTKTFSAPSINLPTGLTLSSAGVLSGTPTASGSFTFVVTATDSVGATGTQSFTVLINPNVSITTTTLLGWTKNFPTYNQTVLATGGTGALTFTAPSNNLPAGITLSAGGVLTGTPTASGTFTFLVTATDSIGAIGTNSLSIVINPIVTITTTSLPAWTKSLANYNQTVASTGGTGSTTFTAPANSLPPGLTLSAAGLISGTPTTAGSYTFTVTATDSIGATGIQSLTIVINPVVSITTTTLPNWTKSFPGYSQPITATGGTGSITCTTVNANLPTGLALSTAGVLSGTPTASGSFTFVVTATDSVGATATQSFTVVINPVVAISTTTLPNWTANFLGYSQTIAASGGTGALTFTTTNASLPPGLALSSGGVLSGTPTTAGNYTFTVTANDGIGATGTQTFTVKINPAVAITTATLPSWTAGFAYSQTVATSGGTGAITFAVTTGKLPAGLSIAASTGIIAGSPTTVESQTFSVTATDSIGASGTKQYTLAISASISITSSGTLTNGVINVPYTQSLSATGGTGTLTFSAPAANLPPGLTLSGAGVLSGVPTKDGTYSFTVTVTDTVGATATQGVTVNIRSVPPQFASFSVTPSTISTCQSVSITMAITTNNGLPATVSVNYGDGSLPVSVASFTGAPLTHAYSTAGTYTVTVTATSTDGLSATITASVVVTNALVGNVGNIIGLPGLPVTLGFGGKCALTFGTPSKSTFTNSRVVSLNLPAGLQQSDLTGLPGTLTIGYGSQNAVTYPFVLTSKGNTKTAQLGNIAFSVKDAVTQFSTKGDARLVPLMQSLGVSSVAGTTSKVLVPISIQIGSKVFYCVQYSMTFVTTTKGASGKLAQ